MRIAEVIGNLTLSASHESLRCGTWLIAVPLSADALSGKRSRSGRGEPLVLLDELSAGPGSWIAVAEGPEASNPFRPDAKPLDAYNAAILDTVDIE